MPSTPAPARHIDLVEVDPDADDVFLARWEDAPATTLYRALRRDARFRFVAVAVGGAEADAPRTAANAFEVIHEDGTPDGDGGVVLINPFEVPGDAADRFLTGWEHVREVLATERGYLGTRLHRSIGQAAFRFVNLARWSSPLAFARAIQRPEFERAAAAMPFASHAALYQVVRLGR